MTAASATMADGDREVRCPRCGYDQRGALSTWIETCPLEGVCTECGLTFRWCEVLQPERFEPRWCIEFEPRPLRTPLAAVRTFVRSFAPWLFWSRLRMSNPIRWPRLAAYPLLLLMLQVAMYVLLQGGMATYIRWEIQNQLEDLARRRPAMIQNLQGALQQYQSMPLTGDPQRDAQIQSNIASISADIASMTAMGSAPQLISRSWFVTTAEAVFTPLARSSRAVIVAPANTPPGRGVANRAYPPPRTLMPALLQRTSLGGSTIQRGLQLPGAWLAWGVMMTLLLPLSFAFMPMSMRRAKVRWAHIIRVTVYSTFIPIVCVTLSAMILVPATFFSVEPATRLASGALRFAPWLALGLWWVAATSRYLKIPHAWFTIAALTLMCLLTLLGLTAVVDGELALKMLDLFDWLIP